MKVNYWVITKEQGRRIFRLAGLIIPINPSKTKGCKSCVRKPAPTIGMLD